MAATRDRSRSQPSPWGDVGISWGENNGGNPPGVRDLPFPQPPKPGEVLEVQAAELLGANTRFLLLQRRIYFRIRSRKLELFLSVPDDVEEMKAGRVVVSSLSEQSSSVWYYEDGLIKNQVRAQV